jgi:hypothetical protein
LFNKSIE